MLFIKSLIFFFNFRDKNILFNSIRLDINQNTQKKQIWNRSRIKIMCTTVSNLYSKSILVKLTNSKSEERLVKKKTQKVFNFIKLILFIFFRYKPINITVDYQTTTTPTHKTVSLNLCMLIHRFKCFQV
jgi:3-phosphoglycerate kinase